MNDSIYVAPAEPVQVAGYRAYTDVYVIDPAWGLVMVSLLGAQTVVEAVWAHLVGNNVIELANRVSLYRGDKLPIGGGEDGAVEILDVAYRKQSVRLKESETVHLVLQSDLARLDLARPGVPAYLIAENENPDINRFWAFFNKITPIPAQPAWAPYLWKQGLRWELAQPVDSYGCRAWRIDPDPDIWSKIVSGGIEDGVLT